MLGLSSKLLQSCGLAGNSLSFSCSSGADALQKCRCQFLQRAAFSSDSGEQGSMPSHLTSPQGRFRIIQFPNKGDPAIGGCSMVDYDIVGSKTVSFHFCTVFPFDVSTKTVTLIKEYAQGANDFLFGVPTGGLSEKHESLEDCVRKELSEEAHLREGTLIKLIPDGHPGILEVKWCRNRFSPFLVLDPEKDPFPLSQDPEEVIEIVSVDLLTLKNLMYGGSMMLPSIVTCNMALHYLEEHKIL